VSEARDQKRIRVEGVTKGPPGPYVEKVVIRVVEKQVDPTEPYRIPEWGEPVRTTTPVDPPEEYRVHSTEGERPHNVEDVTDLQRQAVIRTMFRDLQAMRRRYGHLMEYWEAMRALADEAGTG
jgi:hypothetical protein